MKEKKFVFVCAGKDCKKSGCEVIIKQLKEYHKADKSVKVVKTKCMDWCNKGPNLVVGNKEFHKVTPKSLIDILK